LDVPIDLSKVLFLCTANSLDTLHPALLDRMEIINVAGYTHNEKRHILNKYLLPQAIKNSGILNSEVTFKITDEVKDYIIQNYCREAGVRSLKKYINKIAEKIAFKMVENTNGVSEVAVDVNNIDKFIGHPVFKSSKFYGLLPPPVSSAIYLCFTGSCYWLGL
jgi:ATP-dependent Lon protease